MTTKSNGKRLSEFDKKGINLSIEKSLKSLIGLAKSDEISQLCRDEIEDIIDALIDMKC